MEKDGSGMKKLAFWSICVITFMYLVAQLVRWIDATSLAHIADWIGWAASVVALSLVAILAWGYVRAKKQAVWIILYLIILIVAIVFIVWPRVGI